MLRLKTAFINAVDTGDQPSISLLDVCTRSELKVSADVFASSVFLMLGELIYWAVLSHAKDTAVLDNRLHTYTRARARARVVFLEKV